MNKEKKEYLPAELKLIEISDNDVICTSGWVLDPDEGSWI